MKTRTQRTNHCECGRPLPAATLRSDRSREQVKNGCRHCDALTYKRETIPRTTGSDRERLVYGLRAQVNRAVRAFWKKRHLPEPTGDW